MASGGESIRVSVYDTADDSWSEATPLPAPLKPAGFISVEGKLSVVGGCDHEFTGQKTVFVGVIGQ